MAEEARLQQLNVLPSIWLKNSTLEPTPLQSHLNSQLITISQSKSNSNAKSNFKLDSKSNSKLITESKTKSITKSRSEPHTVSPNESTAKVGSKKKQSKLNITGCVPFKKTIYHQDTISQVAKEALGRGGGRACMSTHANGCRHYGILDLHGMDPKNYSYYSKEGGWLYGKECKSCQLSINKMDMDKISKFYLFYCEMGLKGYKYNKNGNDSERDIFLDHSCDMVLCVKCRDKIVDQHETEIKSVIGGNSRRCSSRKRL